MDSIGRCCRSLNRTSEVFLIHQKSSGKGLAHFKFTHYLDLQDFVICCHTAYSAELP